MSLSVPDGAAAAELPSIALAPIYINIRLKLIYFILLLLLNFMCFLVAYRRELYNDTQTEEKKICVLSVIISFVGGP